MTQLPPNRQLKKLGEVANIVTGKTPSKNREDFWGGDIPFVKPPHLGTDKLIYETEENITEIGLSQANIIPRNSIMVCCIGSLGKIGIAGKDLCTNQQINSIVFDTNKVDFKYGYYFCTTLEEKMNKVANQAIIQIINKSNFSKFEIPLPPLPVQHNIVQKLDEASAQITASKSALQSQLDALDQLWQSSLSEVFENKKNKVKIGELCHIKHGYAFSGKQFADKGDFLLLTPGNFSKENGLIVRGNKEKFFVGEFSQEYLLKKGDLLIAMTDLSSSAPILGAPGIITQDNMLHNQRLGLIQKLSNEIDKNYLYYFFHSNFYRQHVRSTATGTTVRHTSPNRIYEIQIPLPDLTTQTHIVSQLDDLSQNISSLRSQYTAQLQQFDELRASLLDQAFRGLLTD